MRDYAFVIKQKKLFILFRHDLESCWSGLNFAYDILVVLLKASCTDGGTT